VTTATFPGLSNRPAGAEIGACSVTADGLVLEEKIFENRFMHAPELIAMGQY